MPRFKEGDLVVATRSGGQDEIGQPVERPYKGRLYRITDIYEMNYGLGCRLEGLDPYPYKGYFLCRRNKRGEEVWYFRHAEADEPVAERKVTLKELLERSIAEEDSKMHTLSCEVCDSYVQSKQDGVLYLHCLCGISWSKDTETGEIRRHDHG